MIKVKMSYEGNFITGFKVTGHAGYDVRGKDIVCAAVSSVVITSLNMALKLDENAVKVINKEGLIDAQVLKQDEVINKIFENMKEMLQELERDYEKNIKIL